MVFALVLFITAAASWACAIPVILAGRRQRQTSRTT